VAAGGGVAPGAAPAGACGPPPADGETLGAPFAGRTEPPQLDLTLATLGRDGVARPIDRPPGELVRRRGDTSVSVNRFAFAEPNLSIPRGSRIP